MQHPSDMAGRPAITFITRTDENGNPNVISVGGAIDYKKDSVTEIREVEEYGEYAAIPWVEVYSGEKLLARFSQHKLDSVFYV